MSHEQRLKVGMVTPNYLPYVGGLETAVRGLIASLSRRCDVVLVTSAANGVSGVAREDGVEIHRLPVVRSLDRVGVPYAVPLGPGVSAALRALGRSDVLHAHGALYPHSLLAAGVATAKRTPLLLTEHVGYVPYASKALNVIQHTAWWSVGRVLLARADRAVALNTRVQEWLSARAPRLPSRIIANGVDATAFQPAGPGERADARRAFGLPADAVLALAAARDSPKKNVPRIIAAAADSGASLVLCGARRSVPDPHVIDLGVVPYDAMPTLLAAADLFVHAGVGEGFPVAVQEAMARGLPVVLLWDDAYASLVPRDAVVAVDGLAELAPAIRRVAADAELRRRVGAAARAHAESAWSWDAAAQQYEALYADALRERRVGGVPGDGGR